MSSFNDKLTKKPRVTVEERRAREKAAANYARAQAAGAGPLAPLFGIAREAAASVALDGETQSEPVHVGEPNKMVRKATTKPRGSVSHKHREILETVRSLPVGAAVPWLDAPPRKNTAHTLLTYWRKNLGIKVRSFHSDGRLMIERLA